MKATRRGALKMLLGGAVLSPLGPIACGSTRYLPEDATIHATPVEIILDHRRVPYYGIIDDKGELKNTGEPVRPPQSVCNSVGVRLLDVGAGAAVAGALGGGWAIAVLGGAAVYVGGRGIDEFYVRDRGVTELACIERARWERANWGQSTLSGVPAPGGWGTTSVIGDDGWERAIAGGWTEANLNEAIQVSVSQGRGIPQVCAQHNGPRGVLVTGLDQAEKGNFGRLMNLWIAPPNSSWLNRRGLEYPTARQLIRPCANISLRPG